jgi:glycosyltransferase involved in cell wall biosynthesis
MVSLGYPKHAGDSTVPFIEEIVRSLVARGHLIDVVVPHHPDFRQADDSNIRFFPYRYSPFPGYSPWGYGQSFAAGARIRAALVPLLPVVAVALRRAVTQRLSAENYDLVHAHWVLPNGSAAASTARSRNVPLVITLHGSDVAMAERYRPLRELARRTFLAADAVTATSTQLLHRAEALGADPGRASTTYIGVDGDRFTPRPPDPTVRQRLGASPETFLVVAVGRLAEVKGFEHLIAAAAQMQNTAVAIVGDGELRTKLEKDAVRSAASVKLVGAMSPDGVAEAMAAADAVVVPSVVDRAGRVDATTSTALEAMASGRPLVASSVGGIPEIVKDELNGLLVPPKDPAALSNAIERLRRDAPLRKRIADEGRRFALGRSWSATAGEFERIYEQAVNRRSRLE